MSNYRDIEHEHHVEIDAALRQMKLEEVPLSLAPFVMERVRALLPLPRFRLRWIDYVLGVFSAAMLGLVFLVTVALPPFFPTLVSNELTYWTNRFLFSPAPFLLGFAAVSAGFLAFVLVMVLIYRGLSWMVRTTEQSSSNSLTLLVHNSIIGLLVSC